MSEYPLPLRRSELARYWLRSKILAGHALRGGGKKSLQRINKETGELAAKPPRRQRVADWITRKTTAHILGYQAEYEKDLAEFSRSSEQKTPRLSLRKELRARMLARRAFRGDDAAIFDRAAVRQEKKRDKARAEQAVASALGAASVLPSGQGFAENRFTRHEDAAQEIAAFSRELLDEGLNGVSAARLETVKGLVPRRGNQFIMRPAFSKVFAHGQHVETVRNLFVADERANADSIVAYQYVGIARGEVGNGGFRMVQPNKSLPPVENFIVGLGVVPGASELVPVGLLSLTQPSLELLDVVDGLARARQPEGALPRSSISATTRVYDLVMADNAMQRVG